MKLSLAAGAVALVTFGALTLTSVAAQAQMLYASMINGEFGTLNTTTGVFTQIASSTATSGGPAQQLFGLALTPNGQTLYALDGNATPDLYTVNTTTGLLTDIGSTGITGNNVAPNFLSNNSLTFGPGGVLYAIDGTSNLYTINTSTGVATIVGALGNQSDGPLAYNGTLYEVVDDGVDPDTLDTVNTTTGAATVLGDVGYTGIIGMAFTGGTLYAFTLDDTTLTLNTTTGAGTLVGGYTTPSANDSILAATLASSSLVPEPGVYALAASVGLAGVACLRRRRVR